MDANIYDIVKKALKFEDLNATEVKCLFEVKEFTEEYYFIQWAARKISKELCNGKAEIHGQVGADIGACPRDCKYCSFASCNRVFKDNVEFPIEQVIEGALSMEKQGANAIYLMATAKYPFDQFVETGRKVRNAMKTSVPLIANIDDFDVEKAKKLKNAGFSGIYHAIRLGEGVVTTIPVERRIKTIKAAQETGLTVGMCLEPVGPEHTIDELVEKTLLTVEHKAVYSGAGRRIRLPSSELAKHGQVNYARMATLVAAASLATGKHIAGNCTHEPNELGLNAGANLIWAEVGSNPRDTETETVRGWTVERCKELYSECGWEILKGPSQFY